MTNYSQFLSHTLSKELENGDETINIVEVRTGSDSDFSKIKEGILDELDRLEIPYLLTIKSAHRTPAAMMESASRFPGVQENTRLRVITCIACAGGSAHIAGMTASETQTPIIAYPVPSSAAGETDSLPSMINMPPGMPNGCQPIATYTAAMAASLTQLDTQSSDTSIAISDDLMPYVDNELLEEIGVTIDQKSPIRIVSQDLDMRGKGMQDTGGEIPIIVPMTQEPLDHRTSHKYGKIRNEGLYMGVQLKSKPNLTNAILFGAQILGNHNPSIRYRLTKYRANLASVVREKDKALLEEQLG